MTDIVWRLSGPLDKELDIDHVFALAVAYMEQFGHSKNAHKGPDKELVGNSSPNSSYFALEKL